MSPTLCERRMTLPSHLGHARFIILRMFMKLFSPWTSEWIPLKRTHHAAAIHRLKVMYTAVP